MVVTSATAATLFSSQRPLSSSERLTVCQQNADKDRQIRLISDGGEKIR
ncbi:hypothetical protein CASFOL_000985 [Castilleja foliolosa]|uniref:Uncharacterized protein n=1 Tax=Castilleja foliolosa TaxID=1961234 RepID=A0ABD3ELV2_9LAMI